MYSERNLGYDSDNLLLYNAGPIDISISGWSEEIILSTNNIWKHLLPQVLEIATEAWNLNQLPKNNIQLYDSKIIIKYNYVTLKLYIEHSIIFL